MTPAPESTLRCTCGKCGKQFQLSAEDDDADKGLGMLVIQSCDSGGIYGVFVRCPYCRHDHELK